jgi:hypothetical protein
MNFDDFMKAKLSNYMIFKQVKGTFGIEIELEGVHLPIVNDPIWSSKAENSLRNGGMEYITNPIDLDAIPDVVSSLHKQIHFHPAVKVRNEAHRTSTHIHVNYQNETIGAVISSVVLFTLVEPVFLRLCGDNRDGNLFCLSSYDTGDLTNFMDHFLQFFVSQGRNPYPQRGRYAALNVASLITFGTLEYRCFPQSLDGLETQKWARWAANIRTQARDNNDWTCQEWITEAYTYPEVILNSIFGKDIRALNARLGPTSVRDLVGLGCSTAYELSRVIRSHQERVNSTKVEKAEKAPFRGLKKPAKLKWDE